MPPTYLQAPSYLVNILPDNITYAHLGNCGEWDKEDGNGEIPYDWRCSWLAGPSPSSCTPSAIAAAAADCILSEPNCINGHLSLPHFASWVSTFYPKMQFINAFLDDSSLNPHNRMAPVRLYLAPGQPSSAPSTSLGHDWHELYDRQVQALDCMCASPTPYVDGRHIKAISDIAGIPGQVSSPQGKSEYVVIKPTSPFASPACSCVPGPADVNDSALQSQLSHYCPDPEEEEEEGTGD
jgi:hypothetical protein